MAERRAVATGNWSSTATWDGGTTLPGSGDDVHANGFTVTINQDITVLSIRTDAGSVAAAGGGFTVSGTRTINANIVAGSTDCLTISTGSSAITINGNVNGGASSGAEGIIFSASTATLNITGNVTGGSAGTTNGISASATSSSTLTITGNITGGSGASGRGINVTGNLVVNITGNLTGSTAPAILAGAGTVTVSATSISGNSAFQNNGATSVITCSGTIIGSGSSGPVTNISGWLTLNANVQGGSSSTSYGALVSGGFARVNGNVTGGSGASSHGVYMSSGSLIVVGNVAGGSSSGRGIQVLIGSMLVIGNVTGGSNGNADGITLLTGTHATFPCAIYGTVTGGSISNAFGVDNLGGVSVYIFGSTVNATENATSNTGSGSITTVAVGGGSGGVPLIGPGGLVY